MNNKEIESVSLDIPNAENEEQQPQEPNIYKIIRDFSTACENKNIKQVEKIVASLSPQIILNKPPMIEKLRDYKIEEITKILLEFYKECKDEIDQFFLSAATCNLHKLQEIIENFQNSPNFRQKVNQTKDSDSVILFVLKYADIRHGDFYKCLELLVGNGVDINTFDHKGKSALDYVVVLHEFYKTTDKSTLKKVVDLFIKKGVYKPDNILTVEFLQKEMSLDIEKENFIEMDVKTKLIYLIRKSRVEEFLAMKDMRKYADSDDGEHTLLQLACRKSDKMLRVVQHLLKNQANPNLKGPNPHSLTPLELAARNNNQGIFEELLKNSKIKIFEEQYNNFVKWRSQPMKTKIFEKLLESDKLDPSFVYEKTGNSPLHYAILFCHKESIQKLLKRQASLTLRNKFGVCPLDIIDSRDLEIYFDKCLALDNYTPYFTDVNYKMKFRFNCLINDVPSPREVKVLSKIGQRRNLETLLTHPFIDTFITLKWFRVKIYFRAVLIVQAAIFLSLSMLLYRLPLLSKVGYISCWLLFLLNAIFKAPVFLCFRTKNNRPEFFALDRAVLHGFLEIFLIITMFGSFFQNQFRAFVFVEMAVLFLLTVGYHPRLSKWSLMLQQVFKTFTILLMFFSLIIIAFSLGFNVLFPDDHFFQHIFRSIFRTYIMTTGEFNVDEESIGVAGFSGYLLFLFFALSMSLVIVNFWTGVAVTDIDKIEKNSEINASKNVIIFMLFVDYIYVHGFFSKIKHLLPNPFLFFQIEKTSHDIEKSLNFDVDFFVNKEKQFPNNKFPSRVDSECFEKIRCHYYKLANNQPNEKEVSKKLDEILKKLNEMKPCICNNKNSDSESKNTKTRKFKRK